jgi:hypothetical protein
MRRLDVVHNELACANNPVKLVFRIRKINRKASA